MTDAPFGPMHSATRLDRVLQQLRSFSQLHAAELSALAIDLEPLDAELARRLRVFSETQRDETQLAIDELADVRAAFDAPRPAEASETVVITSDPAVDSPKRARWLAEQAARDEALRRPRSRRQLLRGPPHPPSSAPPAAPET